MKGKFLVAALTAVIASHGTAVADGDDWVAWMTRNRIAAGHFALSDQSGVVVAYFKATEVVLWREGRTGDRYLETSLDPAKASSMPQ